MKRGTKVILGVVAVAIGAPVLAFVGLVVFLMLQMHPPGPIIDDDDERVSYLQERAALREDRVEGPSPQGYVVEQPPPGVTTLSYPSEGRALLAWYRAPLTPDKPTLVFLHGGFAFGAEDFTQLTLFLDDGWGVFTPTYRGENGNPGSFELFLGEVDDAANAVRFVAKQPGVSADRIFVFGHSAGAGIAALLALVPDVPARLTGGCGGLYPEEVVTSFPAPFDAATQPASRRIRVLHPHLRHMARPHLAWLGTEDRLVFASRKIVAAAASDNVRHQLKVFEIAGNHHSSLAPSFAAFKAAAEDSLRAQQ